MFNFLLMVCLLFLVSGCVCKYPLTYVPVTEKKCINNIVIALDSIQDYRKNKENIGCNRNLYFMPIQRVQSIQSADSWISYALEQELYNAGYLVDFSNNACKYRLKSDLYNLFIDRYLITRIDIKIGFSLLEDDKVVFSKIYEINRTEKLLGSEFEIYLQQICKELMTDINTYFINSNANIKNGE